MRATLWRLVEWHLGRQLSSDQLSATLGDLAEDLATKERAVGRVRASLWLIAESRSVANAYRAHARGERRLSRRRIMGASWLDDARLARRRLWKHPLATGTSILTLASGIGAAAVVWSLLSSLLLHPLPVEAPERLFMVTSEVGGEGRPSSRREAYVYPTYLTLRESDAFQAVAGAGGLQLLVGGPGADGPRPRSVRLVSHDYFETLGIRMAMGRPFAAEHDRRGAALTAVLSYGYWQNVANADPHVIGQTLTISGSPAAIIGVAPKGFRGLSLAETPDVFLPLHAIADVAPQYQNPFADPSTTPSAWIQLVGRLHAADTGAQAAARLNALPVARRGETFQLVPVETAAIPEPARAGMYRFTQLLALTVGLLLLIGCLTVGMLLLVRTEARRDELAMCLALGGTRLGLARGIAIEGALLALAGAAAAVPVAWWLFLGMRGFTLPGGVEIELLALSLDDGTLLAAAGAALTAVFLITLVAGAFGFTSNVADVLRARAGGTPLVTRRRTRALLVTGQVAVALVLLAGAGLFSRSLVAALTVNPGFDAGRIVTGAVSLAPYGYTPGRAAAFFDELSDRMSAIPGVESVSINRAAGGMTTSGALIVDGVPHEFPSFVRYTAVDERYFPTMGLRVTSGRDFSPGDTAGGRLVIIVSESLGKAIAGGGDPVGHRITESSSKRGEELAVAEIIGVVPDVITSVSDTAPLVKYYSILQREPALQRTIVMRTAGDPAIAIRETLSIVRDLDPLVTPAPMQTIEETLGREMSAQRLGAYVLGALGGIAALLTVLGAYVLAESMAAARRREFSIRRALGATRARLSALVLAETVRLVGLGLLVGLVLAWMAAGTIGAFLFRVEPLDPVVLLSVSGAILVLSLLVSARAAVEAGRVDLTSLLKDE